MMWKYAVIYEQGPHSVGAHVPDLPGCVAAGETLEETEALIREAIKMHLEILEKEGSPAPEPLTKCEYVETPATVAAGD